MGYLHDAVLTPFVMTVVGRFIPRDTACDAGGLLDPKDALSCLFRRGTPPGHWVHMGCQIGRVPAPRSFNALEWVMVFVGGCELVSSALRFGVVRVAACRQI